MQILFVRHGESVDDIEDRYGGWADFDLTENGRRQITDAAEKISSLNSNFEIVLTSPLKRAFQAAEIIASRLDLNLEPLEYLKERNLNGILTGLNRDEAKIKYPKLVDTHNNWEYVDASERTEDFNRRAQNACSYILAMKHDSLIAVTHELFLKTFFKEMMGMDLKKVGDGGFALIGIENGNFRLLEIDGIELK